MSLRDGARCWVSSYAAAKLQAWTVAESSDWPTQKLSLRTPSGAEKPVTCPSSIDADGECWPLANAAGQDGSTKRNSVEAKMNEGRAAGFGPR